MAAEKTAAWSLNAPVMSGVESTSSSTDPKHSSVLTSSRSRVPDAAA